MTTITAVRDKMIKWYGAGSGYAKLDEAMVYDITNVGEYSKQFAEGKPLHEISFAMPPWPFVFAECRGFKTGTLTFTVRTTENKRDDARRWTLDIHIIDVDGDRTGLCYRGKVHLTKTGIPLENTNWECSWGGKWTAADSYDAFVENDYRAALKRMRSKIEEGRRRGLPAMRIAEAERLATGVEQSLPDKLTVFGHEFAHTIPDESMMIFFLATMLANCKNVKSEAKEIPPKVAAKRIKRGQIAIYKYYVLAIDPMQKEIAKSSDGKLSYERAWHICRGHFKEFTKERPLFGRVTGRFWWPMHTRGSVERGKVEKDYELKANDTELSTSHTGPDSSLVPSASDSTA